MICAAVTYQDADLILFNTFNSLPAEHQAGAYWADEALKGLKSRVKAFYIHEQRSRCCYCNRHLGSDNHRVWDLDHIASKGRHPRFLLEPRNLAAACPDCNAAKGEKESLVNPRRKTYPSRSSDFRIVHPHFDSFADHIHLVGFVYLGKTEKGKRTIYDCDLLRFAQKYVAWENSASDTRFEEEVNQAFVGNEVESQSAVDAILEKLNSR